ncbi:MAG: glucose-1-phosphate thymidylyltransferase [Bacteroidetes bacterium]|nr:glucose-1-phosphate thymidylyltransferase [Bacteroidota bacterium]MDA1336263.1 glucose-1-phosphate thymidylyltransferase [Bacteroidota bacterium]
MLQIPFFSDSKWSALYPLGENYRLGHLPIGAMRLSELWASTALAFITTLEQNQRAKVHFVLENTEINDRWIPSLKAIELLTSVEEGQNIISGSSTLLRWKHSKSTASPVVFEADENACIQHVTDLFRYLETWLRQQKNLIIDQWRLQAINAASIPDHVTVIGKTEDIWIHPDATLTHCSLNASSGPIFIGPGAEIQEGSHIRGPFALARNSVIKMGSRIYGPTMIGEECRIGGELSHCNFLGYSNKGHDGFLGQSVIGQWCNLGAATNSSNLKSNYSPVRLWSAESNEFVTTDLQFCGLIMGDHSKCGINTMFNTGTIVGIGCNIFGGGFQPKHIPSFSWGGGSQWELHDFDRFLETAKQVLSRRSMTFTEEMRQSLRAEFDHAKTR